jgi:3'(2'), 5'-bisphosphate nucleotidase
LRIIHAPDKQLTYYAQKGAGAFKEDQQQTERLSVADFDGQRKIKVAVSRRQKLDVIGQYLSDDFEYEYIALGSCSLKNCIIAEGLADCYLRIGPTGEWDTGASQCILEQAGGKILDSEFANLSYNQRQTQSYLNYRDFVTGYRIRACDLLIFIFIIEII